MRLALRRVCWLALVASVGVVTACSDDASSGGMADAAIANASDSGSSPDAGAVDVGEEGDSGADVDAGGEPEPAWCDSDTDHLWDPMESDELELFPDGLFLREDATSPTGWRLDYDADTPWIAGAPDVVRGSLDAMFELTGFGTFGGTLLRFSAPVADVPSGAEASTTDPGWQWVRLDGDVPERVPYEAQILEDGRAVVLWPMVPLAMDADYAVVVTRDARAADGECIAPSATTRSVLHGDPDDARIARAAPVWRDALDALGIAPADVAALTVYRTHDDTGEVRRAADRMRADPGEWGPWQGCTPRRDFLECETSATVLDMRDSRGLVRGDADPVELETPVSVWLPGGEGPWPVIVYGHGLNGDRTHGRSVANRLTALGVVVIAMDALQHGDHPSIDPDDLDPPAVRFMAIDLQSLVIDALAIRGHFNQTNLDRLRMIELLRASPDLDGDGVDDVDPDRIGYIGVSLGAIGGVGLLSLTDAIDAAYLVVGGARMMSIMTESPLMSTFTGIIESAIGDEVLFERLVPVAQHVIDPADAGLFARHVLAERFDDGRPPSVAVTVAMQDDIVPASTGHLLARALGVPHMAPVSAPVELLTTVDAPVSGNLDGGGTAAFFQIDRLANDRDGTRNATHIDTAVSAEVGAQIEAFFAPWAVGEAPVVVDPFPIVGTPPRSD